MPDRPCPEGGTDPSNALPCERRLESQGRELDDAQAMCRGLFENVKSGVCVFEAFADGLDFLICDMNPAGARLVHVAEEGVVGRRLVEVFPGVVEMDFLSVLLRVWRTGEPETVPARTYADARMMTSFENHVFRLPSGRVVAVYDEAPATT